MAFVPLHVHTEYSLFDGMSTVNELIDRADELGFSGIAITDHGTMMGVKEFHSRLRYFHPNIKPILGDEIYITDHYDHRLNDEQHRKTFHLILLAKSLTGYKNLCKIASIGATEGLGKNNKARISHEILKYYHEGLICLSGCIGGEIPQMILNDDLDAAKSAAKWYHEVFGEDFYLEVCEHPNSRPGKPQEVLKMQRTVSEALYELGRELGIKVVATNDSHFTLKEQAEAHDVMLAINCKKKVADTDRLHYSGEEYLKSEAEMLQVFPEHPEVVYNTMDVYEKVERFELDQPVHCPLPSRIDKDKEPFDVLREHAFDGFFKKFAPSFQRGIERLEWELCEIREAGFVNQVLVLEDIILFAKKNDITYGPGRGTMTGSLLLYCLGITKVNPILHDLFFERFVTPGRTRFFLATDFDFEVGGVERIVEYMKMQYGEHCLSGIVTFNSKPRDILLSEVCEAVGVEKLQAERMISKLPNKDVFSSHLPSLIKMRESDEKFNSTLKSSPELDSAYNIAAQLEGRKFSKGESLCGLLLCDRNISNYAPIMSSDKNVGTTVCQYQKSEPEEVGLFRLNFLELNTLNIIKDTQTEIQKQTGEKLCLDGMFDDPQTNELFWSGDTEGIFMFENEIIQEGLRKFKQAPGFRDLVALNAMCRPGLWDNIDKYFLWYYPENRKSSGITLLDTIMSETHGIILYQEQIINFFEEFMCITPEDAVGVYKAFAKRKREKITFNKAEFLTFGKAKGYKERDLIKAWNVLDDAGMYAFLKSHILSYTILSYQCGFLKAYYRELFMSAVHNHKSH